MLFQTGPVDVEDIVDVDTVTGSDIIWAVGIVLVAALIALVLKRYVKKRLYDVNRLPDPVAKLITRALSYVVMMTGVLLALPYLGFQIEPLVVLVLIVGVVVFFAARPLVEEFSAGLVLQTRSPFVIGDQIEHARHVGTVIDIDGRETVIKTMGGKIVRVPNTSILQAPIVNLTAEDARRTTIEVRVEYGVDLDHVASVLENAVADVPSVYESPAPTIGVVGYGDSSIAFEVWIWHTPTLLAAFTARDEAIRSINRALAAEGIVIPFPQRDIWMRSDTTPGNG
ncbi:MAG: mechanosensitive ion channel family protein [Actinomycetota bacterium]